MKEQKRGKVNDSDKVLNIFIPVDVHKRLKRYAVDTEQTVKGVTIQALEEFLKDKGIKQYEIPAQHENNNTDLKAE